MQVLLDSKERDDKMMVTLGLTEPVELAFELVQLIRIGNHICITAVVFINFVNYMYTVHKLVNLHVLQRVTHFLPCDYHIRRMFLSKYYCISLIFSQMDCYLDGLKVFLLVQFPFYQHSRVMELLQVTFNFGLVILILLYLWLLQFKDQRCWQNYSQNVSSLHEFIWLSITPEIDQSESG